VLHDLGWLRDGHAHSASAVLRIGERDLPLRLQPPSRPVGRDDEVLVLETAFDEALAGRCRAVLVSGAPGVRRRWSRSSEPR